MDELKTLADFLRELIQQPMVALIFLLVILAVPKARSALGFDRSPINTEQLAEALKIALVDNDHSPILVKGQIKRICDAVVELQKDVSFIKGKLDV